MGSRIMHFALGKVLAERLSVEDKNGFIIGSILPDALPPGVKQVRNSHFISVFDNGHYKWFDSLAFYDRYASEISSDTIYLGYYFHLIADNIYRQTVYNDMGLMSRRGEESLNSELYEDYYTLNRFIIAEYGLDKSITVPERLADTRLNKDFGFQLEQLLADICSDIDTPTEGVLHHFSMDIIRSFIEKSAEICERELAAIQCGKHVYDRYDMAIENHYSAKE